MNATADKLLAAVDALIDLNQQLGQQYAELCNRGCDHVQQIQFPTPHLADNMSRWRDGLQDSIKVLKETAERFAPK